MSIIEREVGKLPSYSGEGGDVKQNLESGYEHQWIAVDYSKCIDSDSKKSDTTENEKTETPGSKCVSLRSDEKKLLEEDK